jgi:CRP-like cAMP-binding protein
MVTWLMTRRDRTESDRLPLTQEFMAMMLGVQRPTVSLTASNLQSAGVIRYARGKINVVDAQGLQNFACDCYGIIKAEYAGLAA